MAGRKIINTLLWLTLLLSYLSLNSCTVSYKFNGASINYNEIKTISIEGFPLRSAYVWAPMKSMFDNKLQDAFANQTKLSLVKRNADLQLSGEIIGYDQFNKSISASGYSSQTQLKMTVNVRFVNTKNHSQDFERQFTATTDYDSSQQLSAVQSRLVEQMIEDLVDQIYNATVVNW
ncbi:MAG: LptE family protein [Bacteroidales bacterium]|nr:LptE family protein [Bacteroidales bacterium]